MSNYSQCEIDRYNLELETLKNTILDFYDENDLDEEVRGYLNRNYNFEGILNVSDFNKFVGSFHGNSEIRVFIDNTIGKLNRIKTNFHSLKAMNMGSKVSNYNKAVREKTRELLKGETEANIGEVLRKYDDFVLRDYILQEYRENKSSYDSDFNEEVLVGRAKSKIESHFDRNKTEIKKGLAEETDPIRNYEDLKENLEAENDKTTKEKYRKDLRSKTLKGILRVLRDNKFVAKKENLVEKEDSYLFKARKINGEEVLIKINLDGKLSYKFHGYVGDACEEDVESFEKNLNKIYGIKVKNKETLWTENPNLIGKQVHKVLKTKSK